MSPDSCPTSASRSPTCRAASRRSRWGTSSSPDRFQNIFCADVPDDVAAFMAHAQRPLVATAFEEAAAAAAWRTKPSWGVFGTGDQPIAPALHRFSYERAGSTVTEVEGASHFAMLSQPDVVAGVIREAVQAS